MNSLLPAALPGGLAAFPALLVLICVLLFSTATLAFYLKQRLSLTRLRSVMAAGLRGNAVGAALGAATPFCTCTAVPLFLGLLEVDAPLGPAVSFLLASPTINLGAIVLLLVVFGWHTALLYGAGCLTAAILVGWLIGRVPREAALRDYLWIVEPEPSETPGNAVRQAAALARQLTRKLLPWLALATAAGILIDAAVPSSTIAHVGRWADVAGIPAAAILGGIMYADILLLIPIGYALIRHGASTPVVLTFMLAASGFSLPEIVVLSRVLKPRLVGFFVGATLIIYILVGFSFARL